MNEIDTMSKFNSVEYVNGMKDMLYRLEEILGCDGIHWDDISVKSLICFLQDLNNIDFILLMSGKKYLEMCFDKYYGTVYFDCVEKNK